VVVVAQVAVVVLQLLYQFHLRKERVAVQVSHG
jgi:hypothetical protein